MASRIRIDRLLVDKGLTSSRERARRLVLAGQVLVNDEPVDKPGTLVIEQATIRLRKPDSEYVSRGGEKLKGALEAFALNVEGLEVVDIGASTGGFTDCLLQRGVRRVTAVDVGKGQLDWKLRSDPRVTVVEGVNARYLKPGMFTKRFALATVDVAFISLEKILPSLRPLLLAEAKIILLVKPQFELSREQVGKGGIVRDTSLHLKAILTVASKAQELDLSLLAVAPSPILGMEGNREFFLLLSNVKGAGLDPSVFEQQAREACSMT